MFIISIIALLISVIIHEVSHGLIAERLGDPTARLAGRLTLNPIPHIDLFGSILLPLMLYFSNIGIIFGWAKPVPIDPFNLKDPRKDSALIALAGPGSNFVLAIVLSMVIRLLLNFQQIYLVTIGIFFFSEIVKVSIFLGLLNFLPVSPLDGFKIVGGIVPEDKASEWYSLERYGMIFFLALLIPIGGGNLLSFILYPPANFLIHLLLP